MFSTAILIWERCLLYFLQSGVNVTFVVCVKIFSFIENEKWKNQVEISLVTSAQAIWEHY